VFSLKITAMALASQENKLYNATVRGVSSAQLPLCHEMTGRDEREYARHETVLSLLAMFAE
jgi:hypothetical protein